MIRKTMMEKGLGTHDFRVRGTEVSRLEALSDAVFGFAITLLVVSLEVPRTFSQLLELMRGFPAFAASFAILFLIWWYQYRFFRHYGLRDGTTLVLNAVLLFLVLFFVYPLKFVFSFVVGVLLMGGSHSVTLSDGTTARMVEWNQAGQMMLVYGLGYVAVMGVFALMHLHAWRLREVLELNEVEVFDTVGNVRELLLSAGVGLFSIALAVGLSGRWSWVSGIAYMLLGPVLTTHGVLWNRRRKVLLAGGETEGRVAMG